MNPDATSAGRGKYWQDLVIIYQGVRVIEAAQGMEGALALRRWRRDARLSRSAAARALDISERMLAYYEAGTHPVPRAVTLAARALAAGLDERLPMSRDRWVSLVGRLLAYERGEPVVGRMLKARDRQGLRDFLDFVRAGPDPDLALTDPALFNTLRSAVTRAQLGGLAKFRVAEAA